MRPNRMRSGSGTHSRAGEDLSGKQKRGLAILILFSSIFMISFLIEDATYMTSCPECDGDGLVPCFSCHGSGFFWDVGTCPTCNGTGVLPCEICEGTGQIQMLSRTSATLIFFLLNLVAFLGIFGLSCASTSSALDSNPWVKDVPTMTWNYSNRMYDTWLFYHNPKEWYRKYTIICCILGPFLVFAFSLVSQEFTTPPSISLEILSMGFAFGMMLQCLFVFLVYFSFFRDENSGRMRNQIPLPPFSP
ncbi:MAG: hypothetical protein RBG13Loki_2947 [Promethearchaeota archaeon CR_4]|nr:MAG: hypothetical protein RBG13Loki_2947 [Candidatus Lokiarchaeota archaeon CR_4]